MKMSALAQQNGGPAAYGVATGALLCALSISREGGVPGLISGIGVGLELAALPTLTTLSEPQPPYAVGLVGYRRPVRLPSAGARMLGAAVLVVIMAVVVTLLPGWYALVPMLMAAVGLGCGMVLAWRNRRRRRSHRERIHRAVSHYAPRFLIYTGRGGEGSYQLSMWVPVLERLGLPYVVVLRDPAAVAATRAVTTAPTVVCPAGGDLDAIMVDGLRAAFYVNSVAENSSLVGYRQVTHVYLGHGDSDKELSVHPMHAMFDKVFVAGQAAIDRYEAAGVTIGHQQFVVVGRPQLAGVSVADRPISDVDHPRVLYAPTWRGYNAQTSLSSLSWGAKIVAALTARGATVVFSPHPMSWQGSLERSRIAAIDQLLRHDRSTAGRPHRLAYESVENTSADLFDDSDALITDVGSVLVDYFATGKPYGVVLPPSQPAETSGTDLPSTAAAYLICAQQITEYGTDALESVLDDLLLHDPLRPARQEVAHYFLGDGAGDRAFRTAAHELLEDRCGTDQL